MVTLFIPGKPVAKARPRMTRNGHVYTPQKTVDFEALVAQIAAPHFPKPLTGPVKLTVWAVFEIPKSISGARAWRERASRPHTQSPDVDNVAKAVSDALNGIAYQDDRQIFELTARKIWGLPKSPGRTVVHVEEMGATPVE